MIGIKSIIFTLFIVNLLHAAPEVFNSLGEELEVYQKECSLYTKSTQISKKLRAKCVHFNEDVDNAFKLGYSIDTENKNQQKIEKYLTQLRSVDKETRLLKKLIRDERNSARKEKNLVLYTLLLKSTQVKLVSKDYIFMKDNHKYFIDNTIYKQYLEEQRNLLNQEKKRLTKERELAKQRRVAQEIKREEQLQKERKIQTFTQDSRTQNFPIIDATNQAKKNIISIPLVICSVTLGRYLGLYAKFQYKNEKEISCKDVSLMMNDLHLDRYVSGPTVSGKMGGFSVGKKPRQCNIELNKNNSKYIGTLYGDEKICNEFKTYVANGMI